MAYWSLFVVAQNVQGSVTKDMTASKYCVLFLILKSIFCGFICLLIVNKFFFLGLSVQILANRRLIKCLKFFFSFCSVGYILQVKIERVT